MNISRPTIMAFIAASSLALGIGTAAAGGFGPGDCQYGPRDRMVDVQKVQERMQERLQARQERLHKALKLTAAQEEGWQAYIREATPKAEEFARPVREDWDKLTTPERQTKMLEQMEARQKFMRARMDATKTFYATLDAQQKTSFDDFHRFDNRRDRRGNRWN